MNRAEPGHENQARQVNSAEHNRRASAHRGTKNVTAERITNPSPGALLIKKAGPIPQKPMLQTEKAGTGDKEEKDPTDSPANSQVRAKKFGRAKTKQDAGEQIRRSADEEITNAGGNRTHWPEKILPRMRR
jgi:hypothetical protein